jgi:hypothetical protein
MKRYLLAMLSCFFLCGVSLADAADLSRAGGDWDEESSFEWVPAKLTSFIPSMETESPSLIEQAGAVEDISTETSFVNHQRGCVTGVPCDWLTPCGGWNFEAQSLWLRAQQSEGRIVGAGYDTGTRFTFGHTDSSGRSWRVRYFNYFADGISRSLTPLTQKYNLEYFDFEHARRFSWSGGLYGELSAGLRWAQFVNESENFVTGDVRPAEFFSDTIGPVVGGELRGLSLYGWDAYALGRYSVQFGKILEENEFGTFSVTEVQLGLVRNVNLLGHATFVKGFFEAQKWASADTDSEDLGLVGLGFALGMTF